MPSTDIGGLNYFLLQIGSSLLGAYTQLHVSRTDFLLFVDHQKLCLYEIDAINPLMVLSVMYSYNQFLLTALLCKFSKYRNMSLSLKSVMT